MKLSQLVHAKVEFARISCIRRKKSRSSTELDGHLANTPCSCWDGVNLDSPDHKSHVAYPKNGPQQFTGTSTGGACPSTHPVKIPQIMLEVRRTSDSTHGPCIGTQRY
ncbi:MAG: hypothetical protein CL912_13445 [Deltaproteobacteria bacterium]|nr:hypothetical protein [Deltaproteobacteria bacterium]